MPVAVYAVMFAATVAGQVVGMGVDALILGRRITWIPLACSVVLEALAGVRFGVARVSHRLRWGEWGQVSAYYSGCLVSLSLPLVAWTVAYNRRLVAGDTSRDVATAGGVVLAVIIVATVLRQAMMVFFASRRPS